MPPPHTSNLSTALTKIALSLQTILPASVRASKAPNAYAYDHTPEERGVVPMPPMPHTLPDGATFHPYDGRVPLRPSEASSVLRTVRGFNDKAARNGGTERAYHAPDHTYIDVVDTSRTARAHNGAQEPLLLCRLQAVPPEDDAYPHPYYYVSYEHPDFKKRPSAAYFLKLPTETSSK